MLIVVSGPSGAGKSTIVKRVLEADKRLFLSISLTTRPPRPGEREGREYRFVSEEDFLKVRDSRGLLEWASVYGHYYGTPRDLVEEKLRQGLDVVLEIDVQGGMQVKEVVEKASMIFIVPPSIEVLEARLRDRGTDSEETIRKRLESARKELGFYGEYDYVVINDQIDDCVRDVLSIVRAERLRRVRTRVDLG